MIFLANVSARQTDEVFFMITVTILLGILAVSLLKQIFGKTEKTYSVYPSRKYLLIFMFFGFLAATVKLIVEYFRQVQS